MLNRRAARGFPALVLIAAVALVACSGTKHRPNNSAAAGALSGTGGVGGGASNNGSGQAGGAGGTGGSGGSARPPYKTADCLAYGNALAAHAAGSVVSHSLPRTSSTYTRLIAGLPKPFLAFSRADSSQVAACWPAMTGQDALRIVANARQLGFTVVVSSSSSHPTRVTGFPGVLISANERSNPRTGGAHVVIIGLGGLDTLAGTGTGTLVVGR